MRTIDLSTNILQQIPNIIEQYEQPLHQVMEHLTVKGKTLEQALKEQASWPFIYESKRAELRTILKYLSTLVDSTRGKIAKKYIENYSRTLNERTLNAYIDNEEEYLKVNQLKLEVEELYDKYTAVDESFTKRGFALRDITASRIHDIEKALL